MPTKALHFDTVSANLQQRTASSYLLLHGYHHNLQLPRQRLDRKPGMSSAQLFQRNEWWGILQLQYELFYQMDQRSEYHHGCGNAHSPTTNHLGVAFAEDPETWSDADVFDGQYVSLTTSYILVGGLLLTGHWNSGLIASCFRFRSFFINFIPDPIFSSADLMIWTIIEPGMYFIAACFLRLRPLLQKLPTSAWLQDFLRFQTSTRETLRSGRPRPREGANTQACQAGESRGIDADYGGRQDSETNQTYSRDVTLSSTCIGSERSKEEDNIEMEHNAMVTTIMD